MSLKLILMRHAKSSWSTPSLIDHDRPLNGRGRRSAEAMGDWLRRNNHLPDQVLTSTSRRTLETFERLKLDLLADEIHALYHASPETMLSALQTATRRSVLMLGHNPGIAEFAARLVSTHPLHDRFDDYPTCATLIATFPTEDWAKVGYGSGTAVDFITPRELVN